MRLLISGIFVSFFCLSIAHGQKGVDSQTQKIKDDTNKATSRPSDVNRSFDWGKGKTQVRDRLPNPYQLNGRRDALIDIVQEIFKEKKIILDEASSRLSEGVIVSQPFVFGRGQVIATNEMKRYAVLQFDDTAWTRGQYTLTVTIQPIDGIRNNVSVVAKIEGRAGAGLFTEWRTVPSSGLAEEEFLVKLVESMTGKLLDPPQTIDQP
ncbi:hypothetical protein [Leptolyngbya sp. 7M]|uniref:hypothetical protein n=1 Tax=Leptolyngbya sp. 7M TaxID=2812896 RepID=UPI001B8BEAFD|nr:hypothetical protein [Leptolyngbya sp. 7M]QYO66371.1 hypothetical protein JVX88_06105 [Leptolyngbya sp. 7M]